MKTERLSLASLLAGIVLLVVVGATAGTASAATTTTITIVPTQPWTDTGLTVTAGQPLSLEATGVIDFRHYAARTVLASAPNGMVHCLTGNLHDAFEDPGLICYSLVGKIGLAGTPFQVGPSYSATIPTTGELYLGPNDDFYPDNTGDWVVVLTGGTRTPPPPPTTSPPTTMAPPTTVAPATTMAVRPATLPSSGSTPPSAVDAPSGALAFTGMSPVEQGLAAMGVLLVLLGLILYFLGAELRYIGGWFVGL
jgi:hypothetical protein